MGQFLNFNDPFTQEKILHFLQSNPTSDLSHSLFNNHNNNNNNSDNSDSQSKTKVFSSLARDWNNQFQHLLSLKDSEEKHRNLANLSHDFVNAAKTYAIIIINELC